MVPILAKWGRRTALGTLFTAMLLAPGPDVRGATRDARPVATRLQHKRQLPYPLEQVWPASIRYLRVDRGYTIVDRDQDVGFIVFEIQLDAERVARGSVEFVRTQDVSGRPSVDVQVSTDGGPAHLPFVLVDGIAEKVRQERGQPAPPPPPPPTPPPAPPPNPDDDPVLPPGGAPPQIEYGALERTAVAAPTGA